MAKAGKRYPLVIYTRMMDRWWPAIFFIGLTLGAITWWLYQDVYTRLTQPWQWMTMAACTGLSILTALVLLALRNSAYVQPLSDRFVVATPLMRMNVSYKRILRTSTAPMGILFPSAKMSFLKRETIEPLLKYTAVTIELNALPMPRATLRFFLSPFFFKDNTPHIVLLVQNWMSFSTELESLRVSGRSAVVQMERKSQSSLLSQLPRK
jgi:hypothetical protein